MTQAGRRPSGMEGAGGGRGRRGRPGGRAPWAGGPARPYVEVLRLPGALGFSGAGFVARMPMSMFGLGTVLLIAAVTRRYGLAGVVAAVGSVGYAVAAPQFAKLTDRYGQRRVLRPQVMVFGAATAALMVLAEARAPLAAVVISSLLAGAAMPSMGPMVRARWSTLLAGTTRLHTAFSLESVADEVIFMVGPVVVALLATDVYPAAGLAAALLLCLVGTVLFTAQRRTEPPPRPRARGVSTMAGSVPAMVGEARRPRATALLALVPVYGLLGAMFAAIELSTVAFAGEHGHKQLAGLVLGVYALGSAVGGLWYGSRHWRSPLPRRFLITLGLMTSGVAMFWWQPGFASLFPVIFVAGVAIAPTLITGYSLIDHLAPPERRTECMTWLSSAIGVGLAIGAPAAGRLIDLSGARAGYLLAAAFGAAAFVTCLAGLGRLRTPASGTGTAPPPAALHSCGQD
jgi:MFS family permease